MKAILHRLGCAFLLVILTTSCLGTVEHNCIHDQIVAERNFTPTKTEVTHKVNATTAGRRLEASDYEPIRIHVDTQALTDSDDIDAAEKAFLIDTVIPEAISWLQGAIKTIPVEGNLILSGSSCNSADIDSEYTSTGVADTDVIIFATASDGTQSSAAAWAVFCQQDSTTGRPIAGQINFVDGNIDVEDSSTMLAITIHEITHVLVFSSSLYAEYIDPETNTVLDAVTADDTIDGRSRTQMILPTVLAKAKEHFGCDTMTGVELENQGDSGSLGTHFETKLMYNDFMTAQADRWTQYSQITLALFVDSGWYDVDYDAVDVFLYGKDKGCSFVDEKCLTPGATPTTEFPEYWCLEDEVPTCSFNRTLRGVCNFGQYTEDLPSYWQYWSDDSKMGGVDAYMDYCPVLIVYSADSYPSCLTASAYEEGSGSDVIFTGLRDERGTFSRCFTGTYYHDDFITGYDPDNWLENTRAGCHTVDCRNEILYLTIGGVEVTCPTEGGTVTLDSYAKLNGSVQCPAYGDLCPLYDLHGEIIDTGIDEEEEEESAVEEEEEESAEEEEEDEEELEELDEEDELEDLDELDEEMPEEEEELEEELEELVEEAEEEQETVEEEEELTEEEEETNDEELVNGAASLVASLLTLLSLLFF